MNWSKLDNVTVKDIRTQFEEKLDAQIDTLVKLIKQGYYERHHAEKQLRETIGHTLTQLNNLHLWAGLPKLIETLKKK